MRFSQTIAYYFMENCSSFVGLLKMAAQWEAPQAGTATAAASSSSSSIWSAWVFFPTASMVSYFCKRSDEENRFFDQRPIEGLLLKSCRHSPRRGTSLKPYLEEMLCQEFWSLMYGKGRSSSVMPFQSISEASFSFISSTCSLILCRRNKAL